MKTVVAPRQVAHLWAHKTQDNAKSAGRGNIYFQGDTIYSYGSHFPMARHVTNSKGEKAILFTNRTYSNTTAKHLSFVRQAIPNSIPVFYVNQVTTSPDATEIRSLEEEASELMAKSKTARTRKDFLIAQASGKISAATELARFFSIKTKIATPKALEAAAVEIQKGLAKEAEEKKIRAKQALKEAQDQIIDWKNGVAYARIPYNVSTSFGRIEKNELVTSKGARVPLEHVKKIADLVRSLITKGKTYKRNGHSIHLGDYVLDEIKADGTLMVGCHTFDKAEVLRIVDLVKN